MSSKRSSLYSSSPSHSHEQPFTGLETLEPRVLLSGIDQVAGIGYLLSDNGTRFQRYDIANQQWLAPITLEASPGSATASLVDSDGIYVAYDQSVVRYGLDGSSPTHLINTASTVRAIHSDGNLLFLNHSGGLYARFISISKSTNTIIDTMENYVDSVYGSSISATANKIFGRSSGISPADITYVSYGDSGYFGGGGDSPYHGDYAGASQTWVFPLGTKVVDDSGGVYATADLTRLSSFGTSIEDIAFLGDDVPIVLNDNKLTAYTATILPAGSKTLPAAATQILVNSTNVIAFNPSPANPNRYTTQIVALADLQAPQPGQPVDPVGLPYKPDDIEVARDRSLLLLDKETQSIFRWDPQTQEYGATIPLIDVPKFVAYSGATHTIYVAYASGLINSIDLAAATAAEKPFAVLPSSPMGLATAGEYVFASDGSGAWNTHYTFAPDGAQISAVDWNYYSSEYIWSPANSKMYFFRDDTSPNDLLSEPIGSDGTIAGYMDSPLHTSTGFQHPLRVSPDGTTVILGSGMVHDAITLARQTGGLPNAVSDITWMQGCVYTVRNVAGYAQFQQWTGPTFAPGAVAQVQGAAIGLFTIADSALIGIYSGADGVPQFRVMNASFQDTEVQPLWGDVNRDGAANALDIAPFIDAMVQRTYQAEADCFRDGLINALDIAPFAERLVQHPASVSEATEVSAASAVMVTASSATDENWGTPQVIKTLPAPAVVPAARESRGRQEAAPGRRIAAGAMHRSAAFDRLAAGRWGQEFARGRKLTPLDDASELDVLAMLG